MSDTLLNLVNRVLRTTGDAKEVTTVSGSLIAERITDFLNQTIGDVEQAANWPRLRIDAQGTGDGISGIFDFTGSQNIREDGPVSVWIAAQKLLDELTPVLFDAKKAATVTGSPLWFVRRVSSTGKAEVEIYPIPASGDVINMSAYQRASRFDSTVDAGTTEFDDDILAYGALMHLDAYDGLDRGYASLFKNHLNMKKMSVFSNRVFAVETDSYQ